MTAQSFKMVVHPRVFSALTCLTSWVWKNIISSHVYILKNVGSKFMEKIDTET